MSRTMASTPVPSLKLTYFEDGKGRNELTRLIFAVGDVPYVDNLITAQKYISLRDNKSDTTSLPYGQLPTLEVDGQIFGQSCAMARYAAKIAGLYPTNNDIEALKSDAVVDSWRDTLDLFYETIFARVVIGGKLKMFPHPPYLRHGKLSVFVSTELAEQFNRYERFLAANGQICDSSIPFPSWADLAIYDLVKTMQSALTNEVFQNKLMKDKPAVVALVERIDQLESIQKHLSKYPYKDVSEMWAKVPVWRQLVEMVFFPMLRIFFGWFAILRNAFSSSGKPVTSKQKKDL